MDKKRWTTVEHPPKKTKKQQKKKLENKNNIKTPRKQHKKNKQYICMLHASAASEALARFSVCLDCWFEKHVHSNGKLRLTPFTRPHMYTELTTMSLHQTRSSWSNCTWWVEGDHCFWEVRLVLPCCRLVGQKWSYIICVHKRVVGTGLQCTCVRRLLCCMP